MPQGWHDLSTAQQKQPCSLSIYLQVRPVLSEGCLDLQLLLDGGICQLCTVALHLCSCAECTLQPARLIFYILQVTLQAVKAGLSLHG